MNKGKVTGNPAAGPGPPMRWDPRYIYGIGEEGFKGYDISGQDPGADRIGRDSFKGVGPHMIYQVKRSGAGAVSTGVSGAELADAGGHNKYPERIVYPALVRPAGRSPHGGPQHPQAGALFS